MKTRMLTLAILAAFILSITFNTYAQNDTKKVVKKEQTVTDKTTPKKEPKPLMKKKEKLSGEDKTIEKKDMKTMQKMKNMNKPNKKAGTSKTVEKK
jgi:hypothetical protein